jgi:hypothetical protein
MTSTISLNAGTWIPSPVQYKPPSQNPTASLEPSVLTQAASGKRRERQTRGEAADSSREMSVCLTWWLLNSTGFACKPDVTLLQLVDMVITISMESCAWQTNDR